MTERVWQLGQQQLKIGNRPLIMAIVNVTPDSFSDGGQLTDPQVAVDYALRMVEEGADLLDVGGESTRPGATPVPLEEELARVLPVVQALAQRTRVPISIDTSKAEVARRCLEAGAAVVNDVTGLTGDPAMPEVVRRYQAGAIIMHMQGTPATMQQRPTYHDVVAEVGEYLQSRLRQLEAIGIAATRLAVDPGIGFGKTSQHNLQLLAYLGTFGQTGRPVCLGVSRKGITGFFNQRPVHERLAGSLALAVRAITLKQAQILRVHDVRATFDAVTLCAAIDAINPHNPEPA
jgi:dihydropteroate synthase